VEEGVGRWEGWQAWRGVNLRDKEEVAWEQTEGDAWRFLRLGLVGCRWFGGSYCNPIAASRR
jgi:hypothetical protein